MYNPEVWCAITLQMQEDAIMCGKLTSAAVWCSLKQNAVRKSTFTHKYFYAQHSQKLHTRVT